jgi:Domain of unknown function (DUF6456)
MKPVYAERLLNPAEKAASTRGTARMVKVNLAESPLSWLHTRSRISDRQFAAGELLRRDYEAAGLGARVTMAWDPMPTNPKRGMAPGTLRPAEHQLAARERFDGAMATAGAGLADILWRVVCGGESVPDAERVLGWPGRAGRLVLTLALDRLAHFYRIP